MSEDRISALVDQLSTLIQEQALAIEGGRPEAVALLSERIQKVVAECQTLEAREAGAGLRRRSERAAQSARCSRALLQAACCRLAARCVRLSGAGVPWYGPGLNTGKDRRLRAGSAGLDVTV